MDGVTRRPCLDPYLRERIENWSADFAASDAARAFHSPLRESAAELARAFLLGACEARGVEPGDLEEADLKASLLGPVARLGLDGAAAGRVPELCAAFLVYLEEEGRLGGGRQMAPFVRALAPAFNDAASGRQRPIVRPGSKIGPNAPCPCGSGRKYKKCCQS